MAKESNGDEYTLDNLNDEQYNDFKEILSDIIPSKEDCNIPEIKILEINLVFDDNYMENTCIKITLESSENDDKIKQEIISLLKKSNIIGYFSTNESNDIYSIIDEIYIK